MGIIGLWDVLGDREPTSIAEYAAAHFERTENPLRIAVDEATWRYHAPTPQDVAIIRQRVPAANPVEKTLFWRIVKMRTLNIELLFVFDGKRRPEIKRNAYTHRTDTKHTALFIDLLKVFNIPFVVAPGEAEAECARLSREDVVDVVWSEDSDLFAFGCKAMFRDYYEPNKSKKGGRKRIDTHARLYKIEDNHPKRREVGLEKTQRMLTRTLGQKECVLFAILVGGDYNTGGLRGCGPDLALKAIEQGLADSLWEAGTKLSRWRADLVDFLKPQSTIKVPTDFPSQQVFNLYRFPLVSTSTQAMQEICKCWDGAFDHRALLYFIATRFNQQIPDFMKHIGPILLVKTLAQTQPGQEKSNSTYDIKLQQGKKYDADATQQKIDFNPKDLTDIHTLLKNYDADTRVECEISRYILEKGLGSTLIPRPLETFQTSSKRKAVASPRVIEDNLKLQGDHTSRPTAKNPSPGEQSTARKRRRASLSSSLPDVEFLVYSNAAKEVKAEAQEKEKENEFRMPVLCAPNVWEETIGVIDLTFSQ